MGYVKVNTKRRACLGSPPSLPPSPVPPPSHRLTALQVQPGLLDLLLLLSLPSLLLNRISFSCQSSAAPSLFNNPSLFNEFCYVHRGQRRGANLWFHRRSDQRKPMKVRGWERTHTHTHYLLCIISSSQLRSQERSLHLIQAVWGIVVFLGGHFGKCPMERRML